jgi:hypothetical protein
MERSEDGTREEAVMMRQLYQKMVLDKHVGDIRRLISLFQIKGHSAGRKKNQQRLSGLFIGGLFTNPASTLSRGFRLCQCHAKLEQQTPHRRLTNTFLRVLNNSQLDRIEESRDRMAIVYC